MNKKPCDIDLHHSLLMMLLFFVLILDGFLIVVTNLPPFGLITFTGITILATGVWSTWVFCREVRLRIRRRRRRLKRK